MKLKKVSIKNFRSIVDIPELFIDDKVTTLVGANEHGKSNIINALKFLDTDTLFEPSRDFRLDEYSKSHFPRIEYTLKLDEADVERILDLFKEIDSSNSERERGERSIDQFEKEEVVLIRDGEPNKQARAVSNYSGLYEEAIIGVINESYKGRVIHFDDFVDRLASVITESELQDPENLIIRGLLKLSGLQDFRSRLFEEGSQIRKLLRDAPGKLTAEVKRNWFQGDSDQLSINMTPNQSSKTIRVDIEDKNTYVDFEARSRGFKWYLSFFLKYRAYSDGELKNCLFLLDEPGLFLHPRGQKDLINFFETLGGFNQVVYTTHSPFMINRINQQRGTRH